MREFCTYGSVGEAFGKRRFYPDFCMLLLAGFPCSSVETPDGMHSHAGAWEREKGEYKIRPYRVGRQYDPQITLLYII